MFLHHLLKPGLGDCRIQTHERQALVHSRHHRASVSWTMLTQFSSCLIRVRNAANRFWSIQYMLCVLTSRVASTVSPGLSTCYQVPCITHESTCSWRFGDTLPSEVTKLIKPCVIKILQAPNCSSLTPRRPVLSVRSCLLTYLRCAFISAKLCCWNLHTYVCVLEISR